MNTLQNKQGKNKYNMRKGAYPYGYVPGPTVIDGTKIKGTKACNIKVKGGKKIPIKLTIIGAALLFIAGMAVTLILANQPKGTKLGTSFNDPLNNNVMSSLEEEKTNDEANKTIKPTTSSNPNLSDEEAANAADNDDENIIPGDDEDMSAEDIKELYSADNIGYLIDIQMKKDVDFNRDFVRDPEIAQASVALYFDFCEKYSDKRKNWFNVSDEERLTAAFDLYKRQSDILGKGIEFYEKYSDKLTDKKSHEIYQNLTDRQSNAKKLMDILQKLMKQYNIVSVNDTSFVKIKTI